MTFFDRALSFFAPRLALKRSVARSQLRLLSDGVRKYEGAAKTSRMKLWNASDNSADSEIKAGAKELRQRARDLRRNNAYAHRAIQVITTNVVGTGIKPSIKGSNQRLITTAEKMWKDWGEYSTDCDHDATRNIYGIQALVMDAVAESGECFIIRQRRSRRLETVPLQLQVFEPEYLDHSHNEDLDQGRKIRQGIEYNRNGQRLAYWFFRNHPGESKELNLTRVSKVRVPAERVIHCFRQDRPGQSRGASFLHPVMVRLRDIDLFQDASLRKQQVSACYSAFVYNATGDSLDTIETPEAEWELLEKLDSGTIQHLPPGLDIKFANPPSADFYGDFLKQELMSVAAGLGITYEALTQDYGNVNFSSARMGFLEFQRNIKRWQTEILINQLMHGVWDWFLDALQFATPTDINARNLKATWTTPAREMIDPAKEVPANRDAVKSGFKTLSEVLRQSGYNPDEVFEERKQELEKLNEMGLKFETEYSIPAPQTSNPRGENEDEESDEVDSGSDG